MKAPAFWNLVAPTQLARALAPLGRCYMAATAARLRHGASYRAPIPVLCVGNLTAGGTGKTPVVIDLATRLQEAGLRPHILSRGYGGAERGPLRVDVERHRAHEVGDEALLLGRAAPTWISGDRVAAARAAVAAGASVLVMDDGFQDPSVAKHVSLLVVDGGRGFGNGLGIPAGPMREAAAAGLARADAVVLMGDDRRGVAETVAGKPLLRARLEADRDASSLRGRRVFAFAGIGDPAKFLATLEGLGTEVVGHLAYPDHHPYRGKDLTRIFGRAQVLQATPVTTEKDLVRLPEQARAEVQTVKVRVAWEDEAAVASLVVAPLQGRP